MKDYDRGYCTGLYEGEGSIFSAIGTSFNKRKDGTKGVTPRRRICLKITMTDLQPLEIFQESMGFGNIIGPLGNGPGRKNYYQYSADNYAQIQ